MSQLNISKKYKSENYDDRKHKISYIILHYTETNFTGLNIGLRYYFK